MTRICFSNETPAWGRRLRRIGSWMAGLSVSLGLAACGGGGGAGTAPPQPEASDPAAAQPADVAVLMLGNSHTVGAGLPARLQAALQAALPGRSVLVAVAPSSAFLDEHLNDSRTLALLALRRWQAVVLQAQKYSSSGQFLYPTAPAEELVRRSRAQGAVPVLYPEWPRQGIDEAGRIWALHTGIASRTQACVAPVPQAWGHALASAPLPPLYANDGNHAAAAGAQLTALVLMATITGISPATLPDLPGGGDAALQQQLRSAAAAALAGHGARAECPDEALVR